MRDRRSLSATQVVRCAAALVLLFTSHATAQAQAERPPGNPDLKREQREREHREAMLRTVETAPALTRLDEKRIEAAVSKIKDDFRQIQVIRNELVRSILAEKPLDFKIVSSRVEEINKRADRLKTYLMPPIPEGSQKKPVSQVEFKNEEMKGVLVRLCNLIDSFVENPVLKTPGRVDVEQSTKAGGDLLSIIELSSNLKRNAERLKKTTR
jgi:hypothetical protein